MIDVLTGLVVVLPFAWIALRTYRRFRDREPRKIRVVLAFLVLPTLLGMVTFVGATAASVLIWGLALGTFATSSRISTGRWSMPLVVCIVAAFVLPMALAPAQGYILVYSGVFALATAVARSKPTESAITSLVDGVGLYIIANVLAHQAGLANASATARVSGLESTFGGERVFYPFTSALGTPALMAAIFVSAFPVLLDGNTWRLMLRLAALGCGVLVMVETNTRVALVISVVVAVLATTSPSVLSRLAVPTSAAALSLAFVYPVVAKPIVQPLVSWVTEMIPVLSRGSVTGDVSFSGRDQIWRLALEEWRSSAGLFHALFGWGTHGTRTSGASAIYGPLYRGLNSDPLELSAHNSMLQQLFDGGILGVTLAVAAFVVALRAASRGVRRRSRIHLMSLTVLLAAIWGGATEVSVAATTGQEPFWIVVALVFCLAYGPNVQTDLFSSNRGAKRGVASRPSRRPPGYQLAPL